MAKPFDTTLKHLLEKYPQDWLRLLGIEFQGPVKALDADLATVTAAADKVLQLGGSRGWLLHLELQSNYKRDIPDRLHLGNTILHCRHNRPVQSVVVLFRPEADGPAMSGMLRRQYPPARQYLEFRYDVLRVWQLSLDEVFAAGPGALPLAPLVDESISDPRPVIKRMSRQLESKASKAEEASIWTAAYVLMGLRYSEALARELLRGVRAMKESVTYQAIVAEGREEGRAEGRAEGLDEGFAKGRLLAARETLVKVGSKKFGRPDRKTVKSIEGIDDYLRLESLAEYVLDVESWKELLQG